MITGILAGSVSSPSDLPLAAIGFCILAALFYLGVSGKKNLVFCICLLAGIWTGYHSYHLHNPRHPPGHVSRFYNQSDIIIEGRIVSFLRQYPDKSRMVLACREIAAKDAHNAPRAVPAKGSIYLNVYGKTDHPLRYNDLIRFSGTIRPIRNFGNPGAFDYKTFLKRKGIFGAVHVGGYKIDKVFEEQPPVITPLVQALEKTRDQFYHFAMHHLHYQQPGHILAALVTGKKNQMPIDIRDLFSKAGVSHLLAISGLHMGILSMIFFFLFYGILSLFPSLLISARAKKTAGILTLVPLCLYAIFCGFSPSTQRAFIMISFFMVSFLGEKQSHPVNTLAGAGILILLADPASLFSISFQLSFTAVLFIILGIGIGAKHKILTIPRVPGFVMSLCAVTLLAGLGTFPLIARYFHLVSMIQIPANLVLVPVIGFVCLPLALMSLVAWPLIPGLAGGLLTMAAWLVSVCLKYIAWLTELPFAWSHLPFLPMADVLIIYALMAGIFCVLYFKKTKYVVAVCLAILTMACLHGIRMMCPVRLPGHMAITILDVGQGNAALIQSIEGKNILVDGGGFSGGSSFDIGRYVVAPFLWRQRVMTLDKVILTHPDTDHMNGLVFILENFRVGSLMKNSDTSPNEAFGRIMAACRDKNIAVVVPDCQNNTFVWDRTRLLFYQCESVRPGLNTNDNSLVFKLTLDEFSMFFPADIMETRELLLTQTRGKNMASRILLAPHHGSNGSSQKFFLDQIQPESVIISCGFNNPYKFPHPEVLDRYRQQGCKIFRTDAHGAVTITSSGKGYTIVTHKGG